MTTCPLLKKGKKGVGHSKKVLNLGGTAKDKLTLEDNLIFLG
jgi:hypothetical protein